MLARGAHELGPDRRAAAWRLLRAGPLARRALRVALRPAWQTARNGLALVLIFAACAAGVLLLTPLHTTAAVGDPGANLYRLVWDYDRVGFGPDVGRNGHTPAKALRNLRSDLAIWSSDLFGWQIHPAAHAWLQTHTGWWLGPGLSLLFPLLGLIAAGRRRWTWLLAGITGGLVSVQFFYWAGSQAAYSTRYYAEAVPALALMSGAGLAALACEAGKSRGARPIVAGLLAAAILASLIGFTPARLASLWRFNNVGQDKIAALDALRNGRPALILVTGEESRSWRDWGTYMALTSPYLERGGDVVAARYTGRAVDWEAIMVRFPGWQVLELPPDGTLRVAPAP
jgi:hypothetical protein